MMNETFDENSFFVVFRNRRPYNPNKKYLPFLFLFLSLSFSLLPFSLSFYPSLSLSLTLSNSLYILPLSLFFCPSLSLYISFFLSTSFVTITMTSLLSATNLLQYQKRNFQNESFRHLIWGNFFLLVTSQ